MVSVTHLHWEAIYLIFARKNVGISCVGASIKPIKWSSMWKQRALQMPLTFY
jgi:hypothetical protein